MTFPGKAARNAAPLDHGVLVATLAAQRATSDAIRTAPAAALSDEPLTEIVLAGPDWRKALGAQQGCFNRDEAERRL